jgi:hypothetical protein
MPLWQLAVGSLQKTPVFGCAKGQFRMANDFDAPLDDFIKYMQ